MVKCTVGFLQMAGQMFGWVLTLFMRSLPKQLALKPSICWMHTRQASSPLTLLVKRGTFASSLSHQREHAQKPKRPGWPVLKQAHRLYAQSQQWLPAVTAARLSLHCLVQRPPCQISHSSKCPCGSVKWPQCLLFWRQSASFTIHIPGRTCIKRSAALEEGSKKMVSA